MGKLRMDEVTRFRPKNARSDAPGSIPAALKTARFIQGMSINHGFTLCKECSRSAVGD
jgi:hypothetical protein